VTFLVSQATVKIGFAVYDPISFRVGADNNWSPTWDGEIVLPSSKVIDDIDPKTYPKVRVQWWFGDYTAPPLVLDVTLTVRKFDRDETADTVTLGVKSDEIRLSDYKNASTADYAPGAISLRAMFIYAMGKLGITSYDASNIPTTMLPAASTVWKIGQSLADWLTPVMRTAGLEIYQDVYSENPVMLAWDMTTVGKSTVIGSMSSAAYGTNLLDAHTIRDMDDDTWADAAVVTYAWNDSTGASKTKTYIALPAGGAAFRKVYAVTYNAPDPGVNPAPGLLSLRQRGGYTTPVTILPTTMTAPPSYTPTPARLGANMIHSTPSRSFASNVVNMQYSYPADSLQLGLANVVPFIPA
jgi:hypothetical protein